MPEISKKSLSLIVPVYKHLDQAAACLESLRRTARYPENIEFIAQIDPSEDHLEPALELGALAKRNSTRLGFSENCNRAAARATADVLFFVNQDVYATEDLSRNWDSALLSAFESPEVGVVGARLLFPDGSVQSAGGLFDAKSQPFHRALALEGADSPEVSTPCDVSWVTGAAMAVRAGLFSSGFDQGYKDGYFEDTDLCMRIRAKGYRIRYEPRSTLIHRVATTGGSIQFRQNALRFRRKWREHIKPDVHRIRERFW